MDTARVSSKGQVTIPMRVRRAVGIDEGDVLVFTVGAQGKVTLERLNSDEELDALSATFGEWGSAEDDEAYRDL